MVGRVDVVDAHDLLGLDVTEHRHLVHRRSLELLDTPTGDLIQKRWNTIVSPTRISCKSGREGEMWKTHEIGEKTQTPQVPNGSLRRLRLLLASNDRDERNVKDGKVLVADAELELAHGLDERCRLDVSDRTTELHFHKKWTNVSDTVRAIVQETTLWETKTHLDDADVGLFVSLVDGKLGNALDPVLDLVRQVRNDLDPSTKEYKHRHR